MRVLSGPNHVTLAENEVALVMLGRNVAYYLRDFYDYHMALGVRHFLYIDNGSEDGSAEIAAALPDTTVVSTGADFATRESMMRRTAMQRFLSGGWRLALDSDEILDYPGRETLSLPELARRMDRAGYTGLVGQMLECVSDAPLSSVQDAPFSEVRRTHTLCSVEDITAVPYHSDAIRLGYHLRQNRLTSDAVQVLFGGLRRTLFGEECCLTKHPFFKPSAGVVPMVHPHVTTGLTIAPASVLIRHYKFAGGVLQRERDYISKGAVAGGEVLLRASRLETAPEMTLTVPGMLDAPGIEELFEKDFLAMTAAGRPLFAA
ncbi:Glycosyl transferase family 2 [Rhodovulum sp. ES.010]|nr:Glycosyl transferase family 2 [Rhodovulum sp. ES.010]